MTPTAPILILTGALTVTGVAAAHLVQASPPASPRHVVAAGPLPHRVTEPRVVPVPAPRPARRAEVAPARRHPGAPTPRHRRPRVVAHHPVAALPVVAGPTRWSALNRAIARIPGSQAERARWVVAERDGSWGTADWYAGVVYISPRVPERRLYDVVVHEWSHLLSVRPYGGDVSQAVAEMNRVFGGSGLTGAERAADCMARIQGAGWTHYTSCASTSWRAAAHLLLLGRAL